MSQKQKTESELFTLLKTIFTVPQKDWVLRSIASNLLALPQSAKIRTCCFTEGKIAILLEFVTWKDANDSNFRMKETRDTLRQLYELPVEINVTSKEPKPFK